jgi:hypothetical protein
MMKSRARILVFFAVACVCSTAALGLPTPNRGTQLFMLIQERGGEAQVVAMDEPSRWVIQQWNRYNPTYDFISAVAKRTDTGCKLSFIRYVMKEDYIPREEHAELAFPYAEQPRYHLFDYGYITGFYRNSVHDIDDREFLSRQSSNQAMQPTAGRSDASLHFMKTRPLQAKFALASGG